MSEYKHIIVDALEGREPEELAEIVQECERLKLDVGAELDRQDEENERKAAEEKQRRLAARAAAGIVAEAKTVGSKRVRKKKPEAETAEEVDAQFDAE